MAARSLHVVRYTDAHAFLERARPWLMRAEVENNLILGIAGRLCEGPRPGAEPAYLATVEADGEVVACALRTPPFKAIITRASADALVVLVDDVANQYPTLPIVLGPEPDVRHFAEEWGRRHGTTVRAGKRSRIFDIRAVLPERRRPSGVMRAARETDVPLLAKWESAFAKDIGEPEISDPVAMARDRVARESLFVWEDGHPVSMAGWAGPTRNGIRINQVYTPPEYRCHGYASACVADLTRLLLKQGYAWCCLYTDLANPTSNSIYQAMGYRPVCDTGDYLLSP